MEETQIGDFSRPLVRRDVPTTDKLETAESKLAAEAKRVEESLKPLTTYEDQLKAIGVTKEQSAEIVDAVLMQGYYGETFQVTSKLKGRFRSREYRDTLRMQRYLEMESPKMQVVYDEIRYRYMLAASLEQFGQHRFDFPDRKTTADEVEKLFENRMTFVQNLPEATVTILFTKLEKFNRKVFIVTQEGAIENF
jgi:hypothetical protein